MWTATLQLDPAHVIPVKVLGRFFREAYFASFAPLQVQNVPRQPLPDSRYVRVRNTLAGICGSDLHLVFADGDFRVAPAAIPGNEHMYPGHEVVGEIIEIGDDVQRLHVGDRVALQSGPSCRSADVDALCRACAAGDYSLCEHGPFSGPHPIGGGWSEEMLVHEEQLFPVPPALTDAQAMMLEPTAVAVHAVLRCLPRQGERVLVIGAGTIGQLLLQVIHALSPNADVYVLARHDFQIERAARLGAQIIYPQDSYRQVQSATEGLLYEGHVRNRTLLGGFDVIFDSVGSRQTTRDALRWTRAGGTVVMVGVSLHPMHIDLTPIWYQEVNLIGSTAHGMEYWPLGTSERASTFAIAAELMARNFIFPDKLITHRFPLNAYRSALLTASDKRRYRVIKVIFDYSLQPPSVVPNVRASRLPHRLSTRRGSGLSLPDSDLPQPDNDWPPVQNGEESEEDGTESPAETLQDVEELPPAWQEDEGDSTEDTRKI
jgi:threonine dehydrogenase-like Zn-dependent dehydrogenase